MLKRRICLLMSVVLIANICGLVLGDHELDGMRCAETGGTCSAGNAICEELSDHGCGGEIWWCDAETTIHDYDCISTSSPNDECNWTDTPAIQCIGPLMQAHCLRIGKACTAVGEYEVGECAGSPAYECNND